MSRARPHGAAVPRARLPEPLCPVHGAGCPCRDLAQTCLHLAPECRVQRHVPPPPVVLRSFNIFGGK